MEQGESSLAQKIDERLSPDNPDSGFNENRDLPIIIRGAESLNELHSERIIHRDVKPKNIILFKNGQVKFTDFWVSEVIGKNEGSLEEILKETGSAPYMAPEQLVGMSSFQSDIFAYGMSVYEMLSGETTKVFDGEKVVFPVETNIPRKLQAIVQKCLYFDPEFRYQSVNDLINDLEKFQKRKRTRRNIMLSSASVFAVAGLLYFGLPQIQSHWNELCCTPYPKH